MTTPPLKSPRVCRRYDTINDNRGSKSKSLPALLFAANLDNLDREEFENFKERLLPQLLLQLLLFLLKLLLIQLLLLQLLILLLLQLLLLIQLLLLLLFFYEIFLLFFTKYTNVKYRMANTNVQTGNIMSTVKNLETIQND